MKKLVLLGLVGAGLYRLAKYLKIESVDDLRKLVVR
jgi:hypothetical protein